VGARVKSLLLTLVLGLGLAGAAHAQPAKPCPTFAACAGSVTIQPVTAIAYQANLATGDLRQGALLIGVNAITDKFGIPLGFGLYCGSGFTQAAAQCNALFNISNFAAAGIGVQEFKDSVTGKPVYQWLATGALTLTYGGTPTAFREAAQK
jgi:hypothetical protein